MEGLNAHIMPLECDSLYKILILKKQKTYPLI